MTIDTAHLRALADVATPGKRAVAGSRILVDDVLGAQTWGPNWRNDQAFIAAADPQTVLALLDEIERLRGEGEWEYAPSSGLHRPSADRYQFDCAPSDLMRRRKAGPWERVEEDGDA